MKIYQKKYLFFFQTGGRAPGAPVLDPPLIMSFIITKFQEIMLSCFRGVALTNCFEKYLSFWPNFKFKKGITLRKKLNQNSCKYAHLHIMSFITTTFHKIMLSGFRGVALTRKTGLMDWLTEGRVKNIISSATRCVGYKNTAWKIFQVDDEFNSPVYGTLQHFQ